VWVDGGHRALKNENVHFEIFYIVSFSSMYLSTKSYLFECFAQNAGNIFLLFSLAYPYKKRTLLSGRSPGTRKRTWWNHRALAKGHDEIMYIFMFVEHLFLKKNHIFEWPVSQTLRQKHECVVNFLAYWLKKLTVPSARSASTGNLQIASPKSWWFRHDCCWQFVFHRGSTPLIRHWNCEKSAHESTQKRD